MLLPGLYLPLCMQARVAPRQEVVVRAPAHKWYLCMSWTSPV